jgi:ankyrin repeat protein
LGIWRAIILFLSLWQPFLNPASSLPACQRGDALMVATLLYHGATVNRVDVFGFSALMFAAEFGTLHITIPTDLVPRTPAGLRYSGDWYTVSSALAASLHSSQVRSLLPRAACAPKPSGDLSIVHQLLAFGADVSPESDEGKSALYLASKNGHVEVARVRRRIPAYNTERADRCLAG